MNKKRKGFTMFELVVGIVITGLLVFFAYKYFSKPDNTEADSIRMEIDNR